MKTVLWAHPEDIFYDITNSEVDAFYDLFVRRKYPPPSEPGRPESQSFYLARAGVKKEARAFISLADETSYKRITITTV